MSQKYGYLDANSYYTSTQAIFLHCVFNISKIMKIGLHLRVGKRYFFYENLQQDNLLIVLNK